MTYDELRVDVDRALRARFPDLAEAALVALERRAARPTPETSTWPVATLDMDGLADRIEAALHECFPERGERVSRRVRHLLGASTRDSQELGGGPTLAILIVRPANPGVPDVIPGNVAFQRRVQLDREFTVVGRSRTCDVRIEEVGISRRHCEIELRDGEAWITDLGSLNGTYISRRHGLQREQIRVAPWSDARLIDGDSIYAPPALLCYSAVSPL